MRKSVFNFVGVMLLAALVVCTVCRVAGAEPADDGKLRIIVFGAHPDDSEIKVGGSGMLWTAQGHHVKFVSVTNGDVGHWKMSGGALAKRRTAEVEEAARIMGIEETEVMDNHDAELMPTLENRKRIIRLIREWKADIVMSHRPNDYHPDHRYSGILVQDAAYLVTVPLLCPDVPHLKRNPVFMYLRDGFQRPYPFEPDIVVAIDSVIDRKVRAISIMDSQFVEGGCCRSYEGKPDNRPGGNPAKDKAEQESRRKAVAKGFARRFAGNAKKYREKLIELYGEKKGKKVQYAEAFQLCEYGRRPSQAELKKMFPFFGD
ncbi:MAG: PIG-L deacetylase family protein [Planctomycetota bacterium]|jgi:LmbE family N-acetylglucosaminyl deacetylase